MLSIETDFKNGIMCLDFCGSDGLCFIYKIMDLQNFTEHDFIKLDRKGYLCQDNDEGESYISTVFGKIIISTNELQMSFNLPHDHLFTDAVEKLKAEGFNFKKVN